MSMTRKDFIEMAVAMGRLRGDLVDSAEGWSVAVQAGSEVLKVEKIASAQRARGAIDGFDHALDAVVDVLKSSGSNFDRERFMARLQREEAGRLKALNTYERGAE